MDHLFPLPSRRVGWLVKNFSHQMVTSLSIYSANRGTHSTGFHEVGFPHGRVPHVLCSAATPPPISQPPSIAYPVTYLTTGTTGIPLKLAPLALATHTKSILYKGKLAQSNPQTHTIGQPVVEIHRTKSTLGIFRVEYIHGMREWVRGREGQFPMPCNPLTETP